MKNIILNKKLSKIIAISLIVISFLLYAIMPLNVCLPFSACIITGITGAMMLVSEIIFWIGSLMIGHEAAIKIRKIFSLKKFIHYFNERKKGKS